MADRSIDSHHEHKFSDAEGIKVEIHSFTERLTHTIEKS